VRRKPFQGFANAGANSVAAMALTRLHAYTGEQKYYDWAEKTLKRLRELRRSMECLQQRMTGGDAVCESSDSGVITGAEGDSAAKELEAAANSVFRLGKAVLRVKSGIEVEHLPLALRETLPHLPADKAMALVCFGNTCLPPTNEPER